jgi:hypothetical protein
MITMTDVVGPQGHQFLTMQDNVIMILWSLSQPISTSVAPKNGIGISRV